MAVGLEIGTGVGQVDLLALPSPPAWVKAVGGSKGREAVCVSCQPCFLSFVPEAASPEARAAHGAYGTGEAGGMRVITPVLVEVLGPPAQT